MPINNPWLNRGSGASQANTAGLDPNLISTQTTPGQSTGLQTNYLGQTVGASGGWTPGTSNTVYRGPGGTWTAQGGGWVGAGGQKVSDLPGYLQMRQNLQQGANFQPYQQQLNQLLTNPSAIQETPGYKFALEQGNQAINRSAAAKGALNSGGVLAELAKYGQGMASQEYGGQVNRLADLMRGSQQFGVQAGYYQEPQNMNLPYGAQRFGPSTW